jgi:hypothetical protein
MIDKFQFRKETRRSASLQPAKRYWILRLSTAMSTRLLSLIVGLAALIATILAIAAIFGLGGL